MGGSSNPTYDPNDPSTWKKGTRYRSGSSAPSDSGISLQVPGKSLIEYPDALLCQELLRTGFDIINGISFPIGVKDQIDNAIRLQGIVRRWVSSYVKQYTRVDAAYAAFRDEWRAYRMVIPLQLRLVVEQVLYDMDRPWRNLVTGFKPVSL